MNLFVKLVVNDAGVQRPTLRAEPPLALAPAALQIYLGSFATPEAAHAAYVAAGPKVHGKFARAK